MLVLEEYEHAKKRGAKIYAELAGFGMGADAYHMTAPNVDGRSAACSARRCATPASTPTQVQYLNATAPPRRWATSTRPTPSSSPSAITRRRWW